MLYQSLRIFIFTFAAFMFQPLFFAQNQPPNRLDQLNQLENVRSLIDKNKNEVVMLKFNSRPFFELVPNVENGVITMKVFEAKTLLSKTGDIVNNPLFNGYSIKKISEDEFWILLLLNETQVEYKMLNERIKEGYIGIEFKKIKRDLEQEKRHLLLSAKMLKQNETEELILYFDKIPNYTVKEIQLPYYKLEIEMADTNVNLKKEVEGYSPDIINPVKFFEEDNRVRAVIEPKRFGLNYQITPLINENALVISYSNAPLSGQISPAEVSRFSRQGDDLYDEEKNNKNKLLKQQYAEAEQLYRENLFPQSQQAFYQLYQKTPDTDLGIQALFRYSDSMFAQLKDDTEFEQRRDIVDAYLNAINIALDKGYQGSEIYRGLFNIATLYQNIGYLEEALGYYQAIKKDEKNNPYYIEASYFIGEIYHKKRRFKKALEVFQDFIRLYKNSRYYAFALYMIGDTYFELKDYEQSIEYFSKARTLDSRIPENYPKLLYNMAEVYLAAGYPEKARSLYEILNTKYPNNPYIDYIAIRLGDYLRDSGQEKSAIRVYSTIIDKLPKELAITARMRIANIFSEDVNGDYYQKAIDFYDFLIENFPNTVYGEESKFRTAVVLGFQKKYDLSIKEFENFKDNHPSNFFVKSGEVRNKIIDVLNTAIIDNFSKGNHVNVVQYYQNYLRYSTPFNNRFVYLYVANSAEKVGMLQVANNIYQSIMESDNPYNKDMISYKIIKNNLALKNNEVAYEQLNKLISDYSGSIYVPLALKLKADTLVSENNVLPAINLYQQVINKYDSSSNPLLFDPVNQSYYALGDIYANIGKFDDAFEYYEHTINNFKYPINDKRVPNYFKNAMYRVGEMQYENDELEDARNSFDKALKLYPTFERMPWAQYLVGQIYMRQKQPDIALNIYKELVKQANPNSPQLWVRLAREALLEAQNKADYLKYLKQQPAKFGNP